MAVNRKRMVYNRKMRQNRRGKATASQEDYLRAISGMEEENQIPISARLSEELNVTPPAVTTALRRMARDGYVRLNAQGQIRLTAKGRAIARHLSLRHRLAEKLLTDVLGMEWHKVHEEAEKLEHAISPEVEKRLLARFGRDGCCPHGNPLVGGLPRLRRRYGAFLLQHAKVGDRLEVLRVAEKDPQFLIFIDRLELRPGQRLRVRDISYDQTITLEVGSRRIHLSQNATSQIWVRTL